MKTPKKLSRNLLLLAATITFASCASAGEFTNGGFESPTLRPVSSAPFFIGDTNLPGWTIGGTGAYFGIINGQPLFTIAPPEGQQYGVFNGGDQPVGITISQTFDTLIGQSYVVGFNVGRIIGQPSVGDMRITATATAANGASLASLTASQDTAGWGSRQRFTFTATTSATTLTFEDTSTATISVDVTLDNVTIELERPPLTIQCSQVAIGAFLNQ